MPKWVICLGVVALYIALCVFTHYASIAYKHKRYGYCGRLKCKCYQTGIW